MCDEPNKHSSDELSVPLRKSVGFVKFFFVILDVGKNAIKYENWIPLAARWRPRCQQARFPVSVVSSLFYNQNGSLAGYGFQPCSCDVLVESILI